jgi:hypothetical protein
VYLCAREGLVTFVFSWLGTNNVFVVWLTKACFRLPLEADHGLFSFVTRHVRVDQGKYSAGNCVAFYQGREGSWGCKIQYIYIYITTKPKYDTTVFLPGPQIRVVSWGCTIKKIKKIQYNCIFTRPSSERGFVGPSAENVASFRVPPI